MDLVLNQFMRIRLEDPPVCDLLLERRSYQLPDSRCLSALTSINGPTSRDDIIARFRSTLSGADPGRVTTFVDALVAARVLHTPEATHELMPEVESWHRYGWTEALIFHCRTEGLPYVDVIDSPTPVRPNDVLARQMEDRPVPPFWREYPVHYEPLPTPVDYPKRDLGEVLLARRTARPQSGRPMTQQQLSRVLLDANAPLVKHRRAAEREYRSRPSALLENHFGDLETYVVAYDIDGLAPGLYHYGPREHGLGLLKPGCLRDEVRAAFVGQEAAGAGACSLLISIVWERHMFRYANNPRAYRTLMMVIARLAQRYLIGWTAFRFSTFPTPAHYPDRVDLLLGTDRFDESGIYLITAG